MMSYELKRLEFFSGTTFFTLLSEKYENISKNFKVSIYAYLF